MKQLTKEQLNKMVGYCDTKEKRNILRNGENGYCEEEKTVVACCSNCGDYSRAKIPNS